MEKDQVIMRCYKGASWDASRIKDRGIYDVTNKTEAEILALVSLQESMGRNISFKRIQY
ncbi:MAG: hypothetical protein ABII23_03135 [bacterium]